MFRGYFFLKRFDFIADKFGDFTGFNAHHMIMVLTGVQFIVSLATFKIMLFHQPGRFKLIEYPVNRCQPDFFPGRYKATIDVVCGHVPVALGFQNLENPLAGMGHFQTGLFEIVAFHRNYHYLMMRLYCIIHALAHYVKKLHVGNLMIIRFIFALLITTTTATGCKLIYKQNIQQGNAIEQDDLDELYIGMNQRQVLFVLGTPSVKDPFHQERWDYVQTFSRRGNPMVMRTVTLRFESGALAEIVGQNDPFGASTSSTDANAVASFVKKPAQNASGNQTQSPQEASVDAAQEDVLEDADPDINAVNERNAEDREYQRDENMLDQTPNDDPTAQDIDG